MNKISYRGATYVKIEAAPTPKFKVKDKVIITTTKDPKYSKGVVKKVIPPGKEYNKSSVNKYLVVSVPVLGKTYEMYYDEAELKAA